VDLHREYVENEYTICVIISTHFLCDVNSPWRQVQAALCLCASCFSFVNEHASRAARSDLMLCVGHWASNDVKTVKIGLEDVPAMAIYQPEDERKMSSHVGEPQWVCFRGGWTRSCNIRVSANLFGLSMVVSVLKKKDQNFLGTFCDFPKRNWYHLKVLVE